MAVLPSREKIASATLSKAVRSSNTLTSWKLRAMPAFTRCVTVVRVMSSPLKMILPDSGRKRALMTLMSEVLPAPLGPTRETNSRSSMLKLTLSTARVSPK